MRLRAGELLALAGAIAFVATLVPDWFVVEVGDRPVGAAAEGETLTEPGYAGLGIVVLVLVLIPVLLTLAMAVTTVAGRPVAWSVTSTIATTFTGTLLWPVLALRTLLFQPDFGVGVPNGAVGLEVAALLGMLAFLLVPLGGWLAMADERKDAPHSAYEPPEPRPIPSA